jgi:uncharacterized repeat protein (TIGR03803 family)
MARPASAALTAVATKTAERCLSSRPPGTETILHSFGENPTTDGYYPGAALVLDMEGNLYGTTELGGKYVYGTVFKVTP